MDTVACVLAGTPRVFDWLGAQRVIDWCLHGLEQVRGVDRTLVVSALDGFAGGWAPPADVELVKAPPFVTDETDWVDFLRRDLGEVNQEDLLLLLWPTTPFLKSASIEDCLLRVQRGGAANALTVLSLPGEIDAIRTTTKVVLRVQGVRAVGTKAAPGLGHTNVSRIEALDVTDPEELLMARALVDGGYLP